MDSTQVIFRMINDRMENGRPQRIDRHDKLSLILSDLRKDIQFDFV